MCADVPMAKNNCVNLGPSQQAIISADALAICVTKQAIGSN